MKRKMRTKDEIIARAAELRNASPESAVPLFDAFNEAVEAYFTADSELKEKTQYAIHQVTLDAMNRGTKYERQDLMPDTSAAGKPVGYDDVREIFTVGGVWEEIMAVDIGTFVNDFEEDAGDHAENGDMIMTHWQLEAWTEAIGDAREKELAGLQAVISFCEQSGYNSGLAVLFEELGSVAESLGKDALRDRVYQSGGFLELNEVFDLGIYIPTAIKGGQPE